jgi:phospholipid/cholesterol/gamma-HCH transport system substrate-binding protein
MKLKFKYTERFVGVFLLIAVLIILLTIASILVHTRMFETKATYKAKLADATGLSPSTPIYFKGFKIGAVTDFRLTTGNYIEADLEIYKEYKDRIVVNSAIWKGLNPVTNSSSLEFLQGIGSTDLLPEGSVIPSIDVPEGQRLLLAHQVKQAGDPLSTMLANLETFTESITADSVENKGPIFRSVNNLVAISEEMKDISKKMNYLTTALIDDKTPKHGTLLKILDNVAQLTEDFKTTNRMLKTTLQKTDTLLDVYKAPDSLALRMIDPTGEKFVNPLRQTIAGFNAMIPQLQQLTQYANSKTSDITFMLEDVKITLQEAQDTFEAMNRLLGNESTIKSRTKTVSPTRPKPAE